MKRINYDDQRLSMSTRSPFRTANRGDLTAWIGHFVVMNGFADELHDTRFESRGDNPSV